MRSDQFDGQFAIAGTNDILTKLPLVSGDNLEAVCLASELARLQARLVIKDADTNLRGAAESCLSLKNRLTWGKNVGCHQNPARD